METFKTQIPQEPVAQYGRQAVYILQTGHYQALSGRVVRIAALVAYAVQGPTSSLPDAPLPDMHPGLYHTRIERATRRHADRRTTAVRDRTIIRWR
jgi:hypothetical protein